VAGGFGRGPRAGFGGGAPPGFARRAQRGPDGGAFGGPGGLPFGGPGGPAGAGTRGGIGGLLNGATPSAELVALLRQGAGGYDWAAATVGANSAAGIQLATGEPVMAIGGFNGSDPAPTLAQFQRYVAEGRIHYFVGGGFGPSQGGSDAAQQIGAWVEQTFTATTVGGTTVYDLTGQSPS
jgi:hypothetical protein